MSERAHRSSFDSTSASIEYFYVIPSVCAHVIRIHLKQHVYAATFLESQQLTLLGGAQDFTSKQLVIDLRAMRERMLIR